jgi:hypothetical protein
MAHKNSAPIEERTTHYASNYRGRADVLSEWYVVMLCDESFLSQAEGKLLSLRSVAHSSDYERDR